MKIKEQIIWIEYLRVVACFSVVLLHVAAWNISSASHPSAQWDSYFLYNGITRFAVPVFVMISGCLYLDKAREISFEKLFKKYILKFLILYVVWVLFYAFMDTQTFQLKEYEGAKGILQFAILSPKYHLWYLPMMIGLLLITPVAKAVVNSKDSKKLCEYIIILFLLFKVLKPSLLMFELEKETYIRAVLNLLNPDMVCNWVGFYILGHYLAEYQLPKYWNKIIYVLGLAGILFAIYQSNIVSIAQGKINASFYANFSLFSTIWSIAVFVLIKETISKVSVSKNMTVLILNISKYTLGIYLLHPFVRDVLQILHIDTTIGNAFIITPLLSLVIFALSYFIAFVLKKVPIVGKWIV